MNERVIVFVKSCLPGRVKTRIARELGDDAALALYRAMITDLFRNLGPLGGLLVPLCDVPAGLPLVLPPVPGLERAGRQKGADLGEKMYRALSRVFKRGAERAVLIGSDVPYIDQQVITDCLEALETRDAVLGPAADGGYYLIGFRRESLTREVFRNMPWGGSSVLEETVKRLHGRSLHLGKKLRDIDLVQDLEAVLGSGSLAARLPELRATMEQESAKHGKL